MPEDILPGPGADGAATRVLQRYVFVYGTLRQGDDNDITRLLPAPRYIGTATVMGVMYHLGGYPGVVLGAGAKAGPVTGEVYAIEAALERRLDEIEELYPQQKDEYFKRLVPVQMAGQRLLCVCYEINPRYTAGARVIASGDWVKDRHA
ncbi:MAG: gamma-glutamylcyclotransferase [Rhodoferax sp.]|nr:gamma-glutamylcyclotransferase [Rhodoferax sp.]